MLANVSVLTAPARVSRLPVFTFSANGPVTVPSNRTALVPPVVILLRRAAERELEVRLSSQAADVSVLITDDYLLQRETTVGQIAQVVPPGDHLVVFDSDGDVYREYGQPVSSPITGSADGPLGTRIEVSTSDTALS